jgi:hypothetical protein
MIFSPVLHLIQSVRDEAHRFAVTFHRSRRDPRRLTSELEQIPGGGRAEGCGALPPPEPAGGRRRPTPGFARLARKTHRTVRLPRHKPYVMI